MPRRVIAPTDILSIPNRICSIPAGLPFIETLADAITASLNIQDNPEALADAIIYVPNRRSARALALALYRAAGGEKALLMPEIRALGDLEHDEAPVGLEGAIENIGAPLSPSRRLGVLMRLVLAWYRERGLPLPTGAALSAAEELAGLLDEAAIAGEVDWRELDGLVSEADLASHWTDSVSFLAIITDAWPKWLAEQNVLDPLERRQRVAEGLASNWLKSPPQGPIIIAGSTGATPASRSLMAAALAAQQGVVILPGLDTTLSKQDIAAIGEAPNHPQHALVQTLALFALQPEDVGQLVGARPDQLAFRRKLIQESLLPVALTGDWTERLVQLSGADTAADFAKKALNGLDLIAARDETDEAVVVACLLRETLEHENSRAALVTPDPSLARRVSQLLKRWNIDIQPSEGARLLETSNGASLDAILAWWAAPDRPIEIATLLQAEFVSAPDGAADFCRWILHGVKWWRDIYDLRERLDDVLLNSRPLRDLGDAVHQRLREVADWLISAERTLGPSGPRTCEAWANDLSQGLAVLCPEDRIWQGNEGQSLAGLVENLRELGAALPETALEDWLALIRRLAADTHVPPAGQSHPRLAILGPLEARLQSADHFILAGLNESLWPQASRADGFLPRRFRAPLGLPDPDARMGLAAHDFAGLACAPRVSLIYADRRDDSPAVASRWIWRLETLVRGALGKTGAAEALAPKTQSDPRKWAETLLVPLRRQSGDFARPAPCPPTAARPQQFSVTRVETLIRDPYAFYSEQILKLKRWDPINAPVDARQRGTAIHAALEKFNESTSNSPEDLVSLLEWELAQAGLSAAERVAERALLQDAAQLYVSWFESRKDQIAAAWSETAGSTKRTTPDGHVFTLTARADRIERGTDGELILIDYKTGMPPSGKQVVSGLSPQLPLQAVIAADGGFKDVQRAPVSDLIYVAFKARFLAKSAGQDGRNFTPTADLATVAADGLNQLIDAYANPKQPYLSAPRAQFVAYDSDFTRLARRDEWSSEIGDD